MMTEDFISEGQLVDSKLIVGFIVENPKNQPKEEQVIIDSAFYIG